MCNIPLIDAILGVILPTCALLLCVWLNGVLHGAYYILVRLLSVASFLICVGISAIVGKIVGERRNAPRITIWNYVWFGVILYVISIPILSP